MSTDQRPSDVPASNRAYPHPWTDHDPLSRNGDPRLLGQMPEIDTSFLEQMARGVDEQDYDTAIAAVRDGWYDLLRGDQDVLYAVIEKIPHTVVRSSPILAMLTGLTYYRASHRRIKALRLLALASHAAGSDRREMGGVDRALILTSKSVALRLIGRPKHGVDAARSAMDVLSGLSAQERLDVPMLTRIYGHLGATLYYGGDVGRALDAFEQGLAEMPDEGFPHGFMNLAMLAGVHALRGEIHEAQSYLEMVRNGSWPEPTLSGYPGTFYRIAEASVAINRSQSDAGRVHLAAMIHDRRTIEHWIPIATSEALLELVDGRPGTGLSKLDAFAVLRRSEGRSVSARAQLAPTRALLQLALGRPDVARAILQRDGARGPEVSAGLARVELALGRHGAAMQQLRAVTGARMSPRQEAEFLTTEAAALLRFSDRPRVHAVIEHLGSLLEHTGQRLVATLVPQADYRRIRAALRKAGHTRLVAELPETSLLPDADAGVLLTERELAVLDGLMRTPSAVAIADELTVSVNTVKTQLKSVYRKLGVSSRDEAIAVAFDRHLVDDVPLTLSSR